MTTATNAGLAPQERRALILAAEGGDDKAIARAMGITPNTLRTYWTRIREKLGEETRTRLVILAIRRGEIQVEGVASTVGGER